MTSLTRWRIPYI